MQSSRGPPKCDWYADDWDCIRQMANCWLSRLRAKVARIDQRVPADGDAKVMRNVKIDFCYVEHPNDCFWARGDDSWSESATKFWQLSSGVSKFNSTEFTGEPTTCRVYTGYFLALELSTFHRLHISNSSEPPQHQNSAQKSVSFYGKPREMYFPTSRLWAVRERSELFFNLALELRRRGNECSAPPSFGFLCLRTRWKIFWVFFSTFFLLQARVKRFSFSRVHFFHCATLHPPAKADFVPPTFHPCHELYSHSQSDATGGSEQQNIENFRLLYESPTDSSRKKYTDDDESTIEKLLRIAATSSSSSSLFLMQLQEQL